MQFSASCEKHLVTPTIFLDNTSLNWVDSFNYLGYTSTNKKHADDLEIEKRLREAKIRANVVGTRFGKASHDVKQLLFSTFFSNFYCCSLWMPSNRLLKQAKVAFNHCFRAVFRNYGRCSVSHEMVALNLLTFNGLRRKAIYSLWGRLIDSDNSIVTSIIYADSFHNTVRSNWIDLLYSSNCD